MATVYIPPMMRALTHGLNQIPVEGDTVEQLIDALEQQFTGIRDRLCDERKLKPGLVVVVDGKVSAVGLRSKVAVESEVHFLPAIGGG